MPFLFLSPSTQEFNPYVNFGNEEYWMNALTDAMEPYLRATAINTGRNDPSLTVGGSIRLSNAENYDFHLALHSNASPESLAGQQRGIDIYRFPDQPEALRMAELLQENLRFIYPLPERVRILTTTSLAELRDTRAPAVLAELGYHDNLEDALWIQENLQTIAQALCLSVAEYFGLPLLLPKPERLGRTTVSTVLNLRNGPGTDFAVIGKIPANAQVRILNVFQGWYAVDYNGLLGYASGSYISISPT